MANFYPPGLENKRKVLAQNKRKFVDNASGVSSITNIFDKEFLKKFNLLLECKSSIITIDL